jgi:Fe-S cluster assembly protein SufD
MSGKIIKNKIISDLAKYGSGVFVDYSEVNLGQRTMNGEVKVETIFGDLTRGDQYVLHLNKENIRLGMLELNINQVSSNAKVNLRIVVDNDCKVNILETIMVADYADITIEIVVGQNSTVNYHGLQNIGSDKYLTVTRSANVATDGQINWFDFNIGGKLVKSSTSTLLNGQGSSSSLNGFFIANDKQQFDLYNSSTHQVGEANSEMIVKGILDGYSKVVYRGLINIAPMASNSQASQRQDTLLLAPTAEIDLVPDLEIGNNEVKCSHAVTTSTINKDKLFYLTSRGLNELQARKVLIESTLMSQVQKIENDQVREKVLALISEKIK